MKKFPFEKGQYHQCIPNPYRDNEFITVMLVEKSLEYADVDRSIHAAFRVTQGRTQSLTYEEYDIVDPQEADDKEDLGEDAEEDEDEDEDENQNANIEEFNQPRATKIKLGLNDVQNLCEHVDEINGITTTEFARLKKRKDNQERVVGERIAVVGFWKTNMSANFRCYHYFEVPLPIVR